MAGGCGSVVGGGVAGVIAVPNIGAVTEGALVGGSAPKIDVVATGGVDRFIHLYIENSTDDSQVIDCLLSPSLLKIK